MKRPELQEILDLRQWVGWAAVTKIPVQANGFHAKSTRPETWCDKAEADHIAVKLGLPGVGFVFAPEDPYVGIDLDKCIHDGVIEQWAIDIINRFGTYTEYSPSGTGIHILIRGEKPGGRTGMRLKGKCFNKLEVPNEDGTKCNCFLHEGLPVDGVEVYHSGRYFAMSFRPIFEGHVPITDRNNELQNFVLQYTQEDPNTPNKDLVQNDNWQAPEVESWIHDALRYISATSFQDWIKVGLALKNEFGESGFEIWDAWSATAGNYGGTGPTYRQWKTLKPDSSSVGMSSIVWMAQEEGFVMPKGTFTTPDHFNDDTGFANFIGMGDKVTDQDVAATGGSGLEIKWVDYFDMVKDDSPYEEYLIEPRILGKGDMIVFTGPPKSSKSLACLDMFRQFAMGKDWLGILKPSRPLRIAYMQFEVKYDSLRERAKIATLDDYSLNLLRGNFKMTERFTPILNAHGIVTMADSIKGAFGDLTPDIWVIDPLANIYSGKSENDNTDMSQFLREIRYLKNLIDPDVAIVIVHHAAKIEKKQRTAEPFNASRGASALRGAYDTGMYIDVDSTFGHRRKLWFELRNGKGINPIQIEFVDGQFRHYDKPDEKIKVEKKVVEMESMETDIINDIFDESAKGKLFVKTQFLKDKRKKYNQSQLKLTLANLISDGRIRFFSELDGANLDVLNNRTPGYMCVRNQTYKGVHKGLEKVWNVSPTHRISASSGLKSKCHGWDDK